MGSALGPSGVWVLFPPQGFGFCPPQHLPTCRCPRQTGLWGCSSRGSCGSTGPSPAPGSSPSPQLTGFLGDLGCAGLLNVHLSHWELTESHLQLNLACTNIQGKVSAEFVHAHECSSFLPSHSTATRILQSNKPLLLEHMDPLLSSGGSWSEVKHQDQIKSPTETLQSSRKILSSTPQGFRFLPAGTQ